MTRSSCIRTLPVALLLLAGPLLADAAAQVSVPGNYPTIQAAIDAVPSGTTINVQAGTYAEALVIANTSRSLTIRGVSGAAATVIDAAGKGAAAVNVYRSTGTITFQGLTFRHGAPPANISGGGFVIQESSPAFLNCVFESNTAFNGGGGTLIASNATFSGCTIRNNWAQHAGGGVYMVSGSRPVFTACNIVSNASGTGGAGVGNDGAGGGVFSHDSSPTFRGGRISGNSAKFAAGGIFHMGSFGSAYGVAALRVEDAEIADNVAAQFSTADNPAEGGGMHVEDNAVATLIRVQVLRNRANTGAGLNAYRARYDVFDSGIEQNVASPTATAPATTGFGGGISATSNNPTAPIQPASVVNLTRTLVRDNTANWSAGGVGVFGDNFSATRASLSIADSVIVGNVSQSQGGGVLINRGNATISNTLVIGNTSSGGSVPFGGGLLIATNASAAITGSTFASNTAGLNGGGIFMDDTANLNMSGSRIYGNAANNPNGFGGGGLFVGPNGSNTGSIDGSIIADNTQYQIFENPCPKARLAYTNNTITPREGQTDLYVSACSPFQAVTSISSFNSLGNTSNNNSNPPRFEHFLSASRSGLSFTLAWSVGRATSVTIGGVGSSTIGTGIADVTPSTSTTYTLTATATSANGGNYGAVSASVTVVPPPTGVKFVPGDFTADLRSDVSIFRPSTGIWYIRGGNQVTWGGGSDVPLSGDFDGDGSADVAVFRPSTGGWYILRSSGGSLQYTWGGLNDIPVPADYDGDGKTDLGVFRRSNGTWYIYRVGSNTSVSYTWGGGTDVPVQADYDGDGAADVAVFRPSTGTWYVRQSSNGATLQYVWGGSGDIAVPGDYDGDGRSDVAVFRPSASSWYIYRVGAGTSLQYSWGGVGDVPVPGDYDGDNKTDVAIFRPSTGAWYIRASSSAGMLSYTWGGSGDLPILRR